jgi:hypothetical protein
VPVRKCHWLGCVGHTPNTGEKKDILKLKPNILLREVTTI